MGRATNPVTEVTKASSVPVSGSASGKNSLLKTSGGRRAVEEEVVPLEGGADQAGDDDLADGLGR
jgi:hypothetical protein